MTGSIDPQEIAHFARDSHQWWDEDGPFRPLHRLNPVRLGFIRAQLAGDDKFSLQPLAGMKILDIGCGGGLICEPLARMGALVTGIDADSQAIATAKEHAAQSGLDITYMTGSAESLRGEEFDAVLALEIVEHVNDPVEFVSMVAGLCRPGGTIIMSTLNRTVKSFLLGIVAAEYILRWVPRGTHQWRKFVRPSQLARALRAAGARVTKIEGLVYNPVKDEFSLAPDDIDVNYLLSAEKE